MSTKMSKKSKLGGNKETITVLKPKINEKRLNELNENKCNRIPKMNVGYYVLDLDSIQSNLMSDKSNEFCCGYQSKESFERKTDIFDSLTEMNDISVDICKEYFSITKVELPNQQLTAVPNDVWKLNGKLSNSLTEKINKTAKFYDNSNYLNAINLQPVRVLDLSCNYLKQISCEIRNLYFLQVLNLSNNQLTSLPNEVSELVELEEIHLSYNLFQNLPKVLYKLKNLKLLFIQCNYITTIDKEFKYLNQLQLLDISQNNLYSWPYPVLNSKTIVELNLDNNKISLVPDQIHNMKTLKYLRLRYNHIRRLPKLHKMTSLEVAEFRNNSIQNFPDFYGSIHLREVWLDNNQIQKIDANSLIGTVIRLLSVSSNKLNEINGHFSLIDTLRYLDLSNNELKSIPYDFCKMDRLNMIKLKENNFVDPNVIEYSKLGTRDFMQYIFDSETEKKFMIPEGPRYMFIEHYDTKVVKSAAKSDNLQDCLRMTTDNTGHLPNWMFRRAEYDEILRLDLSNNQHVQLPSQLWKTAPFLEELYVRQNMLVKLPMFIGNFLKLRILDLHSNNLMALPQELIYCTELYYLNISNNQFEEIPLIVFSIKKLEVLFASNNKIKEINFGMLRKFKKLDISKNFIYNLNLH